MIKYDRARSRRGTRPKPIRPIHSRKEALFVFLRFPQRGTAPVGRVKLIKTRGSRARHELRPVHAHPTQARMAHGPATAAAFQDASSPTLLPLSHGSGPGSWQQFAHLRLGKNTQCRLVCRERENRIGPNGTPPQI